MVTHDESVTKHYLQAENTIEDGYWDEVFREVSYYENQSCPHPPYPNNKGREVGEFDILYVNYEDKIARYEEHKTSHADLYHAKKQIDRAKEHFEDTEWDIIGDRILEN